ncbi:chorismate mutase [Oceanotoga sp. DSM 15011]|uniref:chorismate mutase n=1 Tax=Oceanotoga teriensis TaxID=515440 RepID=A0AA45HJH2_9BACT|nr:MULTISPECIES: chorismate mutase [Oceanotoga]MDN5341157.1 chorismate mutase [Oceanotoga sp.]MDO7976838.1 chorismate mutase [Oceanotoga teriensis]PWJ95915.1 chorismate mutase [Oceanotoga teriensis]UYP00859.1 chorismate mutase [Oceanotoga sp. DSM 15011]
MNVIRGATSIKFNDYDSIKKSILELYNEILNKNKIEKVYSIIATVTPDITAFNPVTFLRKEFNLNDVAFMCVQEAMFENSPKKIIRLLINCESETSNFIYLNEAKKLRPDLMGE